MNKGLAVPSYLAGIGAFVILAVAAFKPQWIPDDGQLTRSEITIVAALLLLGVIAAAIMSHGWERAVVAGLPWPQRSYVWTVSLSGAVMLAALVALISVIVLVLLIAIPIALAAVVGSSDG